MIWCRKVDATQKRCPIVFQGHPSNVKVTRAEKTPISTRIERFQTITLVWVQGQKIADFDPNCAFPDCTSSFDSLMALKWCTTLVVLQKRCPMIFRGQSSNFQFIWAAKSTIESNLSKITRPVTAIKSLRFALFYPRPVFDSGYSLCLRLSVCVSVRLSQSLSARWLVTRSSYDCQIWNRGVKNFV